MNNAEPIASAPRASIRENGAIGSAIMTLLAFSLPFSTSASTALGLLALPVAIWQVGFITKIKAALRNQIVQAVLFFVFLNFLGLLWTSDMKWGWEIIGKQWKLILLPVYMIVALPKHRQRYLYAFIFALTISCVFSYLIWFKVLHFKRVWPTDPSLFMNHIIFNCYMALALYILLHDILFRHLSSKSRTALILLTAAMTPAILIIQGRTGQIIFICLLILLSFQYFKNNKLKAAIAFILTITILFGGALLLNYNNPTFQKRTLGIIRNINNYSESVKKHPSSINLRITFFTNSVFVFIANPMIGVGTGDFPSEYKQINQKRTPTVKPTVNPHNQYLLSACQFGILGLASLFAIFYSIWRYALNATDDWRETRFAFMTYFLVTLMSESHLLTHGMALLFSLGVAILFNDKGPSKQEG